MKLRVATRGSLLALTQTRWVCRRLEQAHPGLEIEELVITTQGDKILDTPLAKIGGKGLFVSELEQALLEKRADFAVHSMKDLPAELAEGLEVVCVPLREDPRDVLVTADGLELDELTAGARIGTGSLRRVCQLKRLRPDLDYRGIRGNIDTRLRKLEAGEYQGIVLAKAGLSRAGLVDKRARELSLEMSLPAVGQGALAIEARAEDSVVIGTLAVLNDEPTRVATTAERAFLKVLQGGCQVPIAGFAQILEGGMLLRVDGLVGSVDGREFLTAGTEESFHARTLETRLAQAASAGRTLGEQLLSQGAERLIADAHVALARQTQLN